MGVRKRERAEQTKEAKKHVAFAKLNNCPTSPRKMRLIADLIRGLDADRALAELKLNPKEASGRMEKLLLFYFLLKKFRIAEMLKEIIGYLIQSSTFFFR